MSYLYFVPGTPHHNVGTRVPGTLVPGSWLPGSESCTVPVTFRTASKRRMWQRMYLPINKDQQRVIAHPCL